MTPKPKATRPPKKSKAPTSRRAAPSKATEATEATDHELDALFGPLPSERASSFDPLPASGDRPPARAFDFSSFPPSQPVPPRPYRDMRIREDDGLPLATMPIDEFHAYLEAVRPDTKLSRQQRAAALGAMLVRTLEAGPDVDRTPSLVLTAIEALERAWEHFRPSALTFERVAGRYAYAEHVIADLHWAQSAADAQGVPRASLASSLLTDHPAIPVERWVAALDEWHGEERRPRGRPRRNEAPYLWHCVLYRLLTGETSTLDAERFRDNLRKWRRDRNAVRSPT